MKILLYLFLLIGLASCQPIETQRFSPTTVEGTWKLKKMINAWTNQEVLAETLDYEEFYTFKNDSTFIKYRYNGEHASGTYSTGKNVDGFFIQTFYPEETNLRESCTVGTEYLLLKDSHTLSGGSLPCDDPALFYEKEEINVD